MTVENNNDISLFAGSAQWNVNANAADYIVYQSVGNRRITTEVGTVYCSQTIRHTEVAEFP